MFSKQRLLPAFKAASIHFFGSLIVAAASAIFVFGLWFPYPYREVSGGRELFLLVIAVDVVCGPLLTMVLFNTAKQRAELWRDLGFVALIQLVALGYGLNTVWQVRPLFLVQETDRFKVIALKDITSRSLSALPAGLQPSWLSGPTTVAIREPKDSVERQKVMLESIQGGRDYAERPEFYLPYVGDDALKSLKRSKLIEPFLQKYPEQRTKAEALAKEGGAVLLDWRFLPVVGHQDWIALLDRQGQIQGFLKGDGF